MNEKQVIALVAHDKQKTEMVGWAQQHEEELKDYNLIGTDGTAKEINQLTRLEVEDIAHGPQGGDILIASEIIKGNVDILIFFIDPSTSHAHEHDIQALRKTAISNIPWATNRATANKLICS